MCRFPRFALLIFDSSPSSRPILLIARSYFELLHGPDCGLLRAYKGRVLLLHGCIGKMLVTVFLIVHVIWVVLVDGQPQVAMLEEDQVWPSAGDEDIAADIELSAL